MKRSHPPAPSLHTSMSHTSWSGTNPFSKAKKHTKVSNNSTPYIPGFKQLHLFFFAQLLPVRSLEDASNQATFIKEGCYRLINWMSFECDLLPEK